MLSENALHACKIVLKSFDVSKISELTFDDLSLVLSHVLTLTHAVYTSLVPFYVPRIRSVKS